jgi:peptide/nickel transport system permease protein
MTAATPPIVLSAPSRGVRDHVLARLLRKPAAVVSVVVVCLIVAATVGAPLVAPYSPTISDYTKLFAGPSWSHPLGTDEIGRDMLSRILYGGRTSLTVAAFATVVSMIVGVTWGFVAALREGWIGETLMRIADAAMGMPVILLGLVLVAAFGASTQSLVLILGALFAPATARLSRATLLAELRSEYHLAAVSVGATRARIVVTELLPNTIPVLLARATLVAAEAIFVEASLSFVGLGIQPPNASWGTLLQQGYTNLYRSYWYPIFPGVVILIAVLALNTLGDNLQRVLDPSRS